MEVDVVVNPKKRVAEEPMEEIPFAKRTKFKELFPSVFSSIQEMDVNTLKIQNRELVVKLTERTKALETANLELATSDASYTSLSRNISSFAIFMTQVVDELQMIVSPLPGGDTVQIGNINLLEAFHRYVVSETFDTIKLTSVREALVKLLEKVAHVVNNASQTPKTATGPDGAAVSQVSETSPEKETVPGNFREVEKSCLELRAQLLEKEELALKLRERHDEVMERLKRMLNHVARLEIEMEKTEERHEEEKRRLMSSASPSVLKMSNGGPVLNASSALGASSSTFVSGSGMPSDAAHPSQPESGDASHENGNPSAMTNEVVSLRDYQALMARNEEIVRELDDMKELSKSRLTEIEGLREEKVDMLRKSSLASSAAVVVEGPSSSSSDHEHRALKEEMKVKVERIERLLKEISDLKSAHSEAKKKLLETTKAQVEDSRSRLERMAVKFKQMESDRDKSQNDLLVARAAREAEIDHLPRVSELSRLLSDTKSKLEATERKAAEHETLIASLTSDPHAIQTQLKKALEDVQFLRKEIAMPKWFVDLDEAKKESLLNSASELARLTDALQAAKDNEEALGAALSEVSEESTRLTNELEERERRLADLVKERMNVQSLTGAAKKIKQIESVLVSGDKTRGGVLEKMLTAEKRLSAAYKEEVERLQSEVELLKKTVFEYENGATQQVVAMEILRKHCDSLSSLIKTQESSVTDAKVAVESEKARMARVEEELSMMKRRESSSLRSSDFPASSASGSDDREAKTADLFRQFFNCALCDRSRRIDTAITKCGHTFCRICIENKCMKSRNRKCPKCKMAFGASDTLPLFFG